MSLKTDLTAEQFNAVINTVPAAAAYVGLASGGAFNFVREMLASGRFVEAATQADAQQGVGDHGPLVAEVLETLKTMTRDDAQALAQQFEQKAQGEKADPRALAKQAVAAGWDAVKARPGAQEFARWVLDGARAAALTSSGGFLGIGAKSEVDPQEQAALDELAAVLM
jgi:hypothetical protein